MNATYYDDAFAASRARGLSLDAAADCVASAFLDGKPARQGARRWPDTERQACFWTSSFWRVLSASAWRQESLRLALTRYLAQDRFACPDAVSHVAVLAPDVLHWAVRHAGLVVRQDSPRWGEILALASLHPQAIADLPEVFHIFRQAHQARMDEVERLQCPLTALTPLDLLAYASLYAFEHLIPAVLGGQVRADQPGDQDVWDAIDDVLAWKLSKTEPDSLRPDELAIAASLKRHLVPFLFPSSEAPRWDLYGAFAALLEAQVELNAFIGQSADAFSYDDSIRFERRGQGLEIVELDAQARASWRLCGEKLDRLSQYWLYRGMEELMASPEMLALVSPAHLDANLQAFAKATGTWLRLQEVYGIAEEVRTDAGTSANVFRALLAAELMTAFYLQDFLLPYRKHLRELGHPWRALGRLAFDGLLQSDMQIRLPITWSERAAKIGRITSWTVSPEQPQGDAQAAEAILDFWTSDWCSLAERSRQGDAVLRPRWQEKPVLQMGRYLFQLPWMMSLQDNASAMVNNLRRLGARRGEAQAETRRIEVRLGELFEQRGFQVLVGYRLPFASQDDDAGEIDLLCARDGRLFVLELKSTYVRRSMKEAWAHRSATLRKAGWQLHRKVPAVQRALRDDEGLRQALALHSDADPEISAWVIDTSMEWDHQRFRGFLKVSMEEIQIALRDDHRWLNDPEGIFKQPKSEKGAQDAARADGPETLYPEGFTVWRFVEVIESSAVWSM